jgi:hypothetical protein
MTVTHDELLWALRVLLKEDLGDFVYTVRERAFSDAGYHGDSWEHPRVKAWSTASGIVADYAAEHPETEE